MWLKSLTLTNFRNYQNRRLDFVKPTTVIVGRNAAGKTNILEAVYLLSSGESFRAEKIEEMVRWGEEVGHIKGITNDKFLISNQIPNSKVQFPNELQIVSDDQSLNLEPKTLNLTELHVTLTRGVVQGRRTSKRLYRVNGVGRRKQDFVGNLQVVTFLPQDLRLIEGSPSRRRKFLDEVLCQVSGEYRRSLLSYEKALQRRNKVLWAIREGETSRTALAFWDGVLVRDGGVLTEKRREWVSAVNSFRHPVWKEQQMMGGDLIVDYKTSVVSPKRLEEYFPREVASGHTLVGPHKDDFIIRSEVAGFRFQEGRDLSVYGSRGEQRMAVLWLKLSQLAYVEQVRGVRPLLLLDDIFSELDNEHDQVVRDLMGQQQTIITTTNVEDVEGMGEVDVVEQVADDEVR